jgi:hypothetical protein
MTNITPINIFMNNLLLHIEEILKDFAALYHDDVESFLLLIALLLFTNIIAHRYSKEKLVISMLEKENNELKYRLGLVKEPYLSRYHKYLTELKYKLELRRLKRKHGEVIPEEIFNKFAKKYPTKDTYPYPMEF